MKLLHAQTVREIMNFSENDIEETVKRWNIGDDWKEYFKGDKAAIDFGSDILARALTYAVEKYPGRDRETGIFATLVEGFTTGMFGGFGQDQDPLYEKAEEAVLTLVGGIPPTVADPEEKRMGLMPVGEAAGGLLSKDEFTRAAIQLLENICFSQSLEDTIATALTYLEKAIEKMGKSRQAFKSKTIAEARQYTERVKELLERVLK